MAGALLRLGALALGLEIAGIGGLPGPRAVAAVVFAWALLALVLPAAVAARGLGGSSTAGGRGRLALGLGLAAASVSGTFLVVETVVERLFPDVPLEIAADPGSPVPLVQRDPELRGRFTPGFHGRFLRWPYRNVKVRINPQGFRDRPWPPPEDETNGAVRILAVGDSFTFGTGVPEERTWVRRLEGLADGVVAFNGGVPGFGPVDEMIVVRRHVGEVRADVVVMAVYTGNDLDDVVLAERRLAGGDAVNASGRATETKRRRRWVHLPELASRMAGSRYWVGNSRLCYLAAPGVSALALRLGAGPAPGVEKGLLLRALSRDPDEEVERITTKMLDTIRGTAAICRERDARLVAMLIPLRELVEPGAFDPIRAAVPEPLRSALDVDALHARLVRGLGERGVPVLDLQPVLRARLEEGARLFFGEGHLNEAGNEEVARVLTEFLRDRGWLPGRAG